MIEPILNIVFAVLTINYIYFILKINSGLNKLFSKHRFNEQNKTYFISVIIPFRNESGNILKSLSSLESQKYPKDRFEVIYVNDCSTDDSLEKILSVKKSANIKVISINNEDFLKAHKKRAVQYGIKNSIGNIIVTTDCDCMHNENWLSLIIKYFDDETALVAGPVIFKDESTLFSKLQKLEFSGLVLAGAGLIGANEPIICNAANLAYRKDVYNKINGFNDDMQLSSGDDELFMQKIARETDFRIKFCTEKDSVVTTESNRSLNNFMQQRKRWASKGLFYKNKLLIINLLLIYFFYCGLLIAPILALLISRVYMWAFISIILMKIGVEFLVLKKGINFLFSKKLMKLLMIAEFFQIPYIVFAGISGAFGNYTWKGREIKR